MAPEIEIVNGQPEYWRGTIGEPTGYGYIHIGVTVDPIPMPLTPLVPPNRKKTALLYQLPEMMNDLQEQPVVERATAFNAVALPLQFRHPYIKTHADSVRRATFDVAILIETSSPETISEVQNSSGYHSLDNLLRETSDNLHVMTASNTRCVADVEKTPDGLYLFNHFVAEDAAILPPLFEYLAGWYQAETGLTNSTLLTPMDGTASDFCAVNHARWDYGLLRLLKNQLLKRSFRAYVLANLKRHSVGAMPVLYRLV